uniref:CASP-like protein n=1 Tax=Leersia perrieri TaxID=77586 RepID=A0A0D9XZU5_9ORYZ
MGLERKVKVAEVTLRCVVLSLATLAAALVGTGSQTRTFFSVEKTARFTDMKSLVLLVAAHSAAAAYTLLHLARLFVFSGAGANGGVMAAWSVFSCDQAVAYLMTAATAAAMQSSLMGKKGQTGFQWMPVCGLYGAFCRRVGEGLASAVVAGIAAVLLAGVSAFNLFRLYGGGGKRNGGAAGAGNGINGASTW